MFKININILTYIKWSDGEIKLYVNNVTQKTDIKTHSVFRLRREAIKINVNEIDFEKHSIKLSFEEWYKTQIWNSLKAFIGDMNCLLEPFLIRPTGSFARINGLSSGGFIFHWTTG
jgi:hypothetical protein